MNVDYTFEFHQQFSTLSYKIYANWEKSRNKIKRFFTKSFSAIKTPLLRHPDNQQN